jgi:hypothetical protein
MEACSLILFNERVDRLSRSALARFLEQPNYNVDCDRVMRFEWISIDGVTEDDVDAFVLSLRLLIQDRDGFSIHELSKNVYEKHDTPRDIRDRFLVLRHKWEEHSKSESMFRHVEKDGNFTNDELFRTLLYGGLAHVNKDKVALFRRLTKAGFYSSVLCGWFLSSLHILLGVVQGIRKVNEELLQYRKAHSGNESACEVD